LRGREAGPDPFLRQRPFILRQGAKHAEQERPLRRGRIHLLPTVRPGWRAGRPDLFLRQRLFMCARAQTAEQDALRRGRIHLLGQEAGHA
jgi:hypothetical protein